VVSGDDEGKILPGRVIDLQVGHVELIAIPAPALARPTVPRLSFGQPWLDGAKVQPALLDRSRSQSVPPVVPNRTDGEDLFKGPGYASRLRLPDIIGEIAERWTSFRMTSGAGESRQSARMPLSCGSEGRRDRARRPLLACAQWKWPIGPR
jgi:hypothetical protein